MRRLSSIVVSVEGGSEGDGPLQAEKPATMYSLLSACIDTSEEARVKLLE